MYDPKLNIVESNMPPLRDSMTILEYKTNWTAYKANL